jgi:hypothetical protein
MTISISLYRFEKRKTGFIDSLGARRLHTNNSVESEGMEGVIKELYRYILEDIFERKSDFTITDNTVMFRFRES